MFELRLKGSASRLVIVSVSMYYFILVPRAACVHACNKPNNALSIVFSFRVAPGLGVGRATWELAWERSRSHGPSWSQCVAFALRAMCGVACHVHKIQ